VHPHEILLYLGIIVLVLAGLWLLRALVGR
jgi:hypothetical protein